MLFKKGSFIFLVCLLSTPVFLQAQLFPVQATTQLLPPYSVYLPDYASEGSNKLRVILMQGDFTQASYRLRLVMSIELNGRIIMRTSNAFTPGPIALSPGVPTIISGAELAPYLDSHNLDFTGYSREQYERTRALPEGGYRIIFTAYDFTRQDVQVSNVASTFYYLSKNEPPLINFPACGTQVPFNNLQQIIFSWLPRNTASPLSATETEYEFSLYEVRPATRNPNDVVLTTPPIYQATIDNTQLVYGPTEPMLIQDLNYVWRVRAIDKNGRDAFRNNGYSEVCTFKYGGLDPSIVLSPLTDVQAIGETERRGKVTWALASVYEGYRVQYKKRGTGYEWFKEDTDKGELKIFNLQPSMEYEVRVQGQRSGVFGPYSAVISFTTKPKVEVPCGDEPSSTPKKLDNPLASASIGLVIDARGLDMELTEITALAEKGWYKGGGVCKIPYLGTAAFHATFNRVFINSDREVVSGRIDIVTRGTNSLATDLVAQRERRERERRQRENREQWAGTIFYERVFMYGNIDIEEVTIPNDNFINVVDNTGAVIPNSEIVTRLNQTPEQAIIIQDKNGDQWVAQKDKTTGKTTVTKVEAGGLSPVNNAPLSADNEEILKKALALLKAQYSNIANLEADYSKKKKASEEYTANVLKESSKAAGLDVSENNSNAGFPDDDGAMFFMLEEDTQEDPIFKELKLAENAVNVARVVLVLTKTDSKEDHSLIFGGLTIQGKGASEFIADQKRLGIKNEAIAKDIKEALVVLVSALVEKSSNSIIK